MSALTRVGPVWPLYGPPDFPVDKYVARLSHPIMSERSARGREYRYQVCRADPIMFGLHYMANSLRLPNGRGGHLHAIADMHVEIARAALRWTVPDLAPMQVRDAHLWPRRGGKTTWSLKVLPAWAMAFRHRGYLVFYADVVGQATQHLTSLRLEFRTNERLRRDFPDLVEPMRHGGRPIRDERAAYYAANGVMVEAKGMNSATLGAKWRDMRPDCMLLDEIQPQKGKWSAKQAETRLEDIRQGLFEQNDRAVVQITGTTILGGCIMDQLRQRADWVPRERINVNHVPGLIPDPVTGEERSCWELNWPTPLLVRKREDNPRHFAANYDNAPVVDGGTFWRQEHVTYDPLSSWLTDRILVIDPATKSKKSNDETGIGKLAFAGSLRRVVVEDVVGVRLPPDLLRAQVHAWVRRWGIKLILVDTTNGGDHVLNTLRPLPPEVEMASVHIRRSKLDRFTDLHDLYLRRPAQVVHARPISVLESQMMSYPRVRHDDLIDVVALGAEWWLPEAFRGDK